MGDSRRFDLFAQIIRKQFNPKFFSRVADIASGKGRLQIALRQYGFHRVISFDKRWKGPRRGREHYRHKVFDAGVKESFDLLVGMHPDHATDVIIDQAAKRKVPFVVCPCCVMPNVHAFFGEHSFGEWVTHLKRLAVHLGFSVQELALHMAGKNRVIVGKWEG